MFVIQHLHCRRVRRLLWDHLADRLSEGPLELVERHLSDCSRCRREAAGLKQAQAMLESCRAEPMPSPRTQWHTLRARLLDGPPPTPRRQPAWRTRLTVTGGFAAMLLAVAVTVRLSLPVGSLPTAPASMADKPSASSGADLLKTGPSTALTTRQSKPVKPAPNRTESAVDNVTPAFVRWTDLWSMQSPVSNQRVTDPSGSESHAPSPRIVRNVAQVQTQMQQAKTDRSARDHRLAPYDGTSSQFRHYNLRPEDRLPEHSSGQDANDADLQQVSNDGGYVIEPLRPDDDEHPY